MSEVGTGNIETMANEALVSPVRQDYPFRTGIAVGIGAVGTILVYLIWRFYNHDEWIYRLVQPG